MQSKKIIKSKTNFFVLMAIVAITAILVGFLKTFIIPILTGAKTWPWVIYLHAGFAFGWVTLFLLQSILIKSKKHKVHFILGRWAVFIALGAAITIVPAALYQCERELKEGLGQTAISAILGACSSAFIFLLLVVFAITYRKKPQVHKRLMLLATIVLIWPAWFRWRHYFPSVQRPDIWFAVVLADSLIVIAFIWDWAKNKSIHPALLYPGLFFIAEQCMEVILFDSNGWRMLANAIYNLLK
ncbi:MAG: hypothetical protein HEQ40_07390 [Lacibacter sp.]|jgi:uncharacterized membrane protein YuzA (DUF378 family)